MAHESILLEEKLPMAILTLNRPEVLNAMNHRMWMEISSALDHIRKAHEIKVLIITGNGRAFSSGADLTESKKRSEQEYRSYLEELQEVTRKLIRLPKPVIAAINGYALGSGYEIALACDIRLAAESALIGSPEARVNSSVTGGAFRLLQDLVGPGKSAELLFTGENISGREAERIGLVNRSFPGQDLMKEAITMAEKIAVNSSFSMAHIKKGLHMARGEASMETLMQYEIEACLSCVSTEARKNSLESFSQRKKRSV